ncbi:DNA-binding domain-containing protein [uncultured Desulfovibrio sp.]|uniref:DNA-binding domain-containing protein n=1 Tax=Desulfovibrio legallii TaxID=571438 RepID=UPI0026600802|nr:DNA-binding domain-containing protein [uncultured Desulfovibrio sp.]
MATETYSTQAIAALLAVTDRAIQIRAKRESWQSLPRAGRGGGKLWIVSSMPAETVQAIRAALATQAALACADAPLPAANPAARPAALAAVPDKKLDMARARHRIVLEWRACMERAKAEGGSAREASKAVVVAYNAGLLLPAWVHEAVPVVSEKTLYRWEKSVRDGDGFAALADRRGAWTRGGAKGAGQLGEAAETLFLKAYLHDRKPSVHLAWMATGAALEKQGLPAPSYSSVMRFFKRYDSLHHDVVVWMREGNKATTDNALPYMTRDSRILEPGDVLVADGHKMNFTVINPDTGKPCRMTLVGWLDWASGMFLSFEIMVSENTQAIASSLHRAILKLGKRPRAVYIDNGQAFKNKFFENKDADVEEFDGLYLRLGIHVQHSAPYQARTKVIERWWGDFDRQAAVLMDSYVGRDIADKPAHLRRNETWLARQQSGYVPTVADVQRLVMEYARWKAQQPHPTRPGSTPWDVFDAGRGPGFSEEEKTDLARQFLYRREVTPSRCRVRMLGLEYESDALYGVNKPLTAYYSYADMREIYLYDGQRFLGTARPVATVNPLAVVLGDDADMRRISEANKKAARLRKQTRDLAERISGAAGETLLELPYMRGVAQRRQPVVVQGTGHANGRDRIGPASTPQVSEAERRAIDGAVQAALERRKASAAPVYTLPAYFSSELEKYDVLFRLRHEDGMDLNAADAAFMASYEAGREYQTTTGRRYEQLLRLYDTPSKEQAG